MFLRPLQGLLDLRGQILLFPFQLEVVFLRIALIGILYHILLRPILKLLDSVGDVLLVGDDGHHFFLHPLVDVLEFGADGDVFGVFLDKAEHLLEDQVVDCVVLDPFAISAVV